MYTKKGLKRISKFEASRLSGRCEIGLDVFAQDQGLGAAHVMLGRAETEGTEAAPRTLGEPYAVQRTKAGKVVVEPPPEVKTKS